MDSSETDIKKMYDIGQVGTINKLHNMQWLKSNSQLSGHTKTLLGGNKIKNNNLLKSETNEGTKEGTELRTNAFASTSIDLESCGSIPKIYIQKSDNIVTKHIQSTLTSVELPQTDMETVWNKDVNVSSTLFPNRQSLVIERLDEQEMLSMALAESIVTAQIEQFRLDEEQMSKSDDPQDKSDDEWGTIRPNLPDLPKPNNDVGNEANLKQCHDNNNNNAKSKGQSVSEVRKDIPRAVTKTSVKKTSEQKTKRLSGGTVKGSNILTKQGSKEKDDSVNLSKCDDINVTSAADSKNLSVATSNVDKCGKLEGYNTRQTFIGKGAKVKEQQCMKQQFSTSNDVSNKNKFSASEGPGKSNVTSIKLKPSKTDSNRKSTDADDTKKCHRIQPARTLSYNSQYDRTKSAVKSQLKHSKTPTKLDQETNKQTPNKQYTSGDVSRSSISAEDGLNKLCKNEQSIIEKQASDVQHGQCTSGKTLKSSEDSERNRGEKSSTSCRSFTTYKSTASNSFSAKTNVEKNTKDDQGYTAKLKRDSNVFRRSSDYTEPKYVSARTKTGEQKESIDNNSAKDYRISRTLVTDVKSDAQPGSPRITVTPSKTVTGASKTKKTDTSSTINSVQSSKILNSCSNSTKVPTTSITAPNQTQKEPQASQAPHNGTEVQSTVKTEEEKEEHSNNNSNNKTIASISETKSVKFSDNVQEISTSIHSPMTCSSVQPIRNSTNPFYNDLQNTTRVSNAQQNEGHQNMESKKYYDNVLQYDNALSASIQSSNQDFRHSDVSQQKTEPMQIFPQNIASQNTHNPLIAPTNGFHYQNMYLNQYDMQALSRKAADTSNIPQNPAITSNPSYNMENQSMVQTEASNILMQNNQTSVLPPHGFHNHPMATQHNQWNVPLSDVLYFGNMMNAAAGSAHPLNMQIPNNRQLCGTDFNTMQQAGYLQHPFFYMPSLCMQGWNPLLQYPTPLFQNTPYVNCGTYPNQVMGSNNPADSVNCPSATSPQDNPYKQQYQVQQFDSNPGNYSAPMKVDNYMGNMQGYKPSNVRMKGGDGQMRGSQYRAPVPNEYQNYSQDAQMMAPMSYPPPLDSVVRNAQSNLQAQANQKYHSRYVYTASYERMLETALQNSQDSHRRDEASKIDSECIPPMVSPRECMYYGVNYSRKTENNPNLNLRSDIKPAEYNSYSAGSQHPVSQFQNNSAYHAPPKDFTSRVAFGRYERKMADQ